MNMPDRIDISIQELEYLIEIETEWGIKESLTNKEMINELLHKEFIFMKVILVKNDTIERIRLTSKGNQALLENRPWVMRHIEMDGNFCKSSSAKTPVLIRLYAKMKENNV